MPTPHIRRLKQALLLSCCFALGHPLSGAEPIERRTVSFRQGVNGYAGTVDTEVWALATTTILESNINMSSDANNDGGESQVLMRFDDIIGSKAGQVPLRSTIHSAKLLVGAFDQGNTVNLHRMLVPFDRSATWGSLISGVSADGLEAARQKSSFTFGKIAASTSEVPFDVTDSVQAWVNGAANHGWVFINTGGDGWDFYASEFENIKQRLRLVIEFTPRSSTTVTAVSK
ncbi:MAG TPA: DNRLRE domain-containing protein [Planctomycetaceae bacterium]|nr:DNRLRE domain-containing protein [Planctomycetaceae bacterium]